MKTPFPEPRITTENTEGTEVARPQAHRCGLTALLPYAALLAAIVLLGCNQPTQEIAHGSGNSQTAPVASRETAKPDGQKPSDPKKPYEESILRKFHLKDLQRVTLEANKHKILAWVMDTDAKRQEGMMWLVDHDVKDDDGMIFAFPDAKPQGFWMENTILPLDIIFISPDKKVLNIQAGTPGDRTNLPSKGAAMYVLEMKQGSADRLGIVPGTPIAIPTSVKGK